MLSSRAGLSGGFNYDSGVYYAASDALIHGRVPYRDFVLLHPPGITLALAPFAALGRLTTDHRGFIVATVACCVLGAVNAALVVRVARRLGFGLAAQVVGGLCYAVWFGSVDAEYLIRLEPVGNFLVLVGMLFWARAATSGNARWSVLSGVAFGAAAATKIWWVAPLAVMAGWLLAPGRRHHLLRFLAGAAGALIATCGPFFVLAPGRMWQMVVVDQLGRPRYAGSAGRPAALTGLGWFAPRFTLQHEVIITVLAAVVVTALCLVAARARGGLLPIALLVVALTVLLAAPSWYPHYADFLAPWLALTASAAVVGATAATRGPAGLVRRLAAARTLAVVVTAAVCVAAVTVVFEVPNRASFGYPTARFAAASKQARCVMSDAPMPLILMDVLSRDLENGCQNWVDVTGRTYGGADAAPQLASGRYLPRADDPRWQRDLTAYLFSGDVITLVRPANTGIGPVLRKRLTEQRVLARSGTAVLYATKRAGVNARR